MKLDTPITRSAVHKLYYASIMAVLIVIGVSIGLSFWQRVSIAVVAVVIFFMTYKGIVLKHLSLDETDCQLLVVRNNKDELWQGKLISASHHKSYAVLDFEIYEPIDRRIRFCVFYDQMNADDWRVLSVIVRYL